MSRIWLYRVLAANVLIGTAVHAVRPIASFRAIELGAGPAEVGVIGASYALIPLVVAVFVGRWVDRWGEPLFLAAGSVGVGLVALLLVWADSLLALGTGIAVLGLSQILTAVSIQTLIANADEPGRRDSRFGWQSVAASLGQLLGPIIAGFLAGASAGGGSLSAAPGIRLVFISSALLGAVATLIALSFVRDRPRSRRAPSLQPTESTAAATRRIIKVPSMPQAMFASMAVLTSVDILIVYLPVFALATGIDVRTVGLLLAARAAASLLSRLLISPLRVWLGRRELLALAMAVPAIALATLPIIGSVLAPLFAIMVVVGFGLGLGQPLTASWVATRSPPALRGMAVGIRLSGNRFGQLVVPAVVGLLAGVVGLSSVFWSLTTMLATGSIFVGRASFSEEDDDG